MSETRPARILCVDDDASLRALTTAHLERQGLSVVTAADGPSALDTLADGEFDGIVSDFEMPAMDGLELLEAVRARHEALPFVLFTARGSEELASRAISAGVTDYIRKNGGADQFELLANRAANYVSQYRAERALDRSEERYRRLVETSPSPIGIYTEDSRLAYVNEAAVGYFGAEDADDLVGRSILELVDESDLDRARERSRGVLEERTTASPSELHLRGLDGRPLHAVLATAPITFEGDDAAQIVLNDVTEFRRTQRAFEREKQFTDAALDALDDVFFVVDTDGRLTRWNGRLNEVTGYDDAELDGILASAFFPDDDACVEQAAEALFANGTVTFDGDLLTKSSELVPFEVRAVRMTDDGDVVGACGIARDVSERRARERELEQYRTVVQTIPDATYVLDTEGYIQVVNDAHTEGTGDSVEDSVGVHVSQYLNEEGIARGRRVIESLLADESRSSGRFEFEIENVDGERRRYEDHISVLIDEDGQFDGSVSIVRDITEHIERERALSRQNERLEAFASVVSHDLRNPLNVVDGYLELARETGEEDHFDAMKRALDRMDSLIDDLLSLARNGQVVDERESVELRTAAERAWGYVPTEGAALVVDDSHTVDADEARLRELFENLFRNSVEHGSTYNQAKSDDALEHGSTGSRTESDDAVERGNETVTVRVGASPEGFYVADDGPGIPEDERDAVLEYGYSTNESGTGFGLTIVTEIAEAHGWETTVSESDSGGARFDFRT
ncbi:PAS domain S-box protein [Haloprofundus salinisoli]|uniref:PAS domain S-box protein n=1 Tax=Haloprofundus salinisoli TaxID=2876193 RepID=UPI001CCE4396|nr:PAS domain S-box protein [Haloprofundus salinisoli]